MSKSVTAGQRCTRCGHTRAKHRMSQTKACTLHCDCTLFSHAGVAPPRRHGSQKIFDADLLEALEETSDVDRLAERLGVHARTIVRRLAKLPDHERRAAVLKQPIPDDQLAIARERAEEGMPMTWATEEFGHPVKDFRLALHMGTPPGWNAVRKSIYRNPTLRKLHEEFAPAGRA